MKRPTQELVFGVDCPAINEGRIASVQSLSGTGAVRLAAEFLRTQVPQCREAYVSNPTWPVHYSIFAATGFAVKEYSYWDKVSWKEPVVSTGNEIIMIRLSCIDVAA